MGNKKLPGEDFPILGLGLMGKFEGMRKLKDVNPKPAHDRLIKSKGRAKNNMQAESN